MIRSSQTLREFVGGGKVSLDTFQRKDGGSWTQLAVLKNGFRTEVRFAKSLGAVTKEGLQTLAPQLMVSLCESDDNKLQYIAHKQGMEPVASEEVNLF